MVIAEKATGFIYYVSVAGTTGARATLPPDIEQHLQTIRQLTDKPIAVGFGISTPEQARNIARIADGVIVGSAIVRIIAERGSADHGAMLGAVADFAGGLSQAVRSVTKPSP